MNVGRYNIECAPVAVELLPRRVFDYKVRIVADVHVTKDELDMINEVLATGKIPKVNE